MSHSDLDPSHRIIVGVAFVLVACAAGYLPIWWLGANEYTGFLTLYPLAPVAVGGPLLTVGYLVTGHDIFRLGQRVALFLLIAGNVTLLASHTWGFILFGGCWDCGWPSWVAKLMLVSTPVVIVGALIPRARKPPAGSTDSGPG